MAIGRPFARGSLQDPAAAAAAASFDAGDRFAAAFWKQALNNGVAGALEGPSSYLMKSPPVQIVDDEAYEATEKFIAQNALTAETSVKKATSAV